MIQLIGKYKNQISKFFKATESVSCPAFPNEKIIFNAKGVNHLIYKGSRSRRDKSRIQTNIRLLPRALEMLRLMPLWQEKSNYVSDGVRYQFWCFEAVTGNRRIKIIIRQVGKGRKHFWSVIPAWRRDRYGILNAKNRNLDKV